MSKVISRWLCTVILILFAVYGFWYLFILLIATMFYYDCIAYKDDFVEKEVRIENILNWIKTAKPDWGDINKADPAFLVSLVEEEKNELKEALEAKDKKAVTDAVVDIIWMALNSAAACGITYYELVDYMVDVEESNYSKFCDTEEQAKETVRLYKEGLHPDKIGVKIATIYKKIGDKYVIFREEDGKILKSKDYHNLN